MSIFFAEPSRPVSTFIVGQVSRLWASDRARCMLRHSVCLLDTVGPYVESAEWNDSIWFSEWRLPFASILHVYNCQLPDYNISLHKKSFVVRICTVCCNPVCFMCFMFCFNFCRPTTASMLFVYVQCAFVTWLHAYIHCVLRGSDRPNNKGTSLPR